MDEEDVTCTVTVDKDTSVGCTDDDNEQNTATERAIEAVTGTVDDVAVLPQCDDGVSVVTTIDPPTDRKSTSPEMQECGRMKAEVPSPARGVKQGVTTRAVSTDVKFRCSPKSRKAPPVPPPPTVASKDRRRLSADGDRMSDDGEFSENGPCRNVVRDSSPVSKCPVPVLPSCADTKPALKPKPVTAIVRESPASGDQSIPTGGTTSPVYAVVNKSRTQRSTSTVDCGSGDVSKPSVARSKSTLSAGSTPPKKPPRTFAHSEYMQLKSQSLPRSSESPAVVDYEEETGSTKTSSLATCIVDPVTTATGRDNVDSDSCEVSEPATKTADSVVDGLDKELTSKTKDVVGRKVRRRQSDKLPAPPRPPPPSFTDSRSSTLSARSSVVDSDVTVAGHSEQGLGKDPELQRQEQSSLSLETTSDGRSSVSDVPDDDDVYAVPSEVTCDNISRATAADRSHLSGASSTTSDAKTQSAVHSVALFLLFCCLC